MVGQIVYTFVFGQTARKTLHLPVIRVATCSEKSRTVVTVWAQRCENWGILGL